MDQEEQVAFEPAKAPSTKNNKDEKLEKLGSLECILIMHTTFHLLNENSV